jgi:hypothetical protein
MLTTTIIPNLKIISSTIPYNADELKEATENISRKETLKIKAEPETEIQSLPQTNEVSTGRLFEQGKLSDYYLEMVNYVLWALEKSKDPRNNKPNYPKTWHTIAGEDIKNSSQSQRNIGNIIFQISNEKLVALMKQSEIFKEAVLTCGTKVHSAKKRLPEIRKLLDIK